MAASPVLRRAAEIIFTVCGFFAILAVVSITLYMVISGTPALFKVGILDILFGDRVGARGKRSQLRNPVCYSDFHCSVTFLAVLIGVPIGVMTAVFLAEVAPTKVANIVRPAIELLAGIPSVIYGLLGILILNPLMYKLEMIIFSGSTTHQFTGGANLISAVLVLALMILPTVINISETSLRAVPAHLKSASLALGATHIQTIFHVIIPAAKSGIVTAIVLGTGRAIGEGDGDQPGIRKLC